MTLNDLSYSGLAKLVQESAISRRVNRSRSPFLGGCFFSLLDLFVRLFQNLSISIDLSFQSHSMKMLYSVPSFLLVVAGVLWCPLQRLASYSGVHVHYFPLSNSAAS